MLAVLVVGLTMIVAAEAKTKPVKTTTLIAETTVQVWRCQDKLVLLGAREKRDEFQSPWSLPKSQKYRKWVLKQRVVKQRKCLERLHYVSSHKIPNIQDWLGAVQWVQRIYPGTSDWMRSISDREGGWGGWVWYGGRGWSGWHIGNDFLGADTVGGWMQFRYSTFAPYWRGAQEDLKRRGYILPNFRVPPPGGDPRYAAWLNPMGQALTAGYMRYTGKDGCHWCL